MMPDMRDKGHELVCPECNRSRACYCASVDSHDDCEVCYGNPWQYEEDVV